MFGLGRESGKDIVFGKIGRIEWGYYPAGLIDGYTVAQKPDGTWRIRAMLVHSNAVNLSMGLARGELVFIAPIKIRDRRTGQEKQDEWRWPVRQIESGTALGPREIVASLGELLP